MATRAELLGILRGRYASAPRPERGLILDEFVAVSGYHRKHAIRLLRQPASTTDRRGRSPVYDAAVKAALVLAWEASDRICGKRLRALLPVLVPAMERHGHLRLDEVVRTRLMAMSAATMDRLLREARGRGGAGRRRRPGVTSAVRRGVRVRTFADWGDPPPGFMEMDLVAHSGPSMAGAFAWTLVLTDAATGWTECVPLPVRDGALVTEALVRVRELLPFPLKGIDVDNDSAFMNEAVVGWCRANGIEPTRSRAYRKNDQAWVEQKNGAVVRRLVGHDRLEGLAAAGELGLLYASARLFVNFFQPSFKLAAKRREGARVSRRYHAPATPHARLLARPRTSTRRPRRAWRRGSRPSTRSRCWRRSARPRSAWPVWRPTAGTPIHRRPRPKVTAWPASWRGSPWRGGRAKSGPPTGRGHGRRATGARGRTRSRRSRRPYARG